MLINFDQEGYDDLIDYNKNKYDYKAKIVGVCSAFKDIVTTIYDTPPKEILRNSFELIYDMYDVASDFGDEPRERLF